MALIKLTSSQSVYTTCISGGGGGGGGGDHRPPVAMLLSFSDCVLVEVWRGHDVPLPSMASSHLPLLDTQCHWHAYHKVLLYTHITKYYYTHCGCEHHLYYMARPHLL